MRSMVDDDVVNFVRSFSSLLTEVSTLSLDWLLAVLGSFDEQGCERLELCFAEFLLFVAGFFEEVSKSSLSSRTPSLCITFSGNSNVIEMLCKSEF